MFVNLGKYTVRDTIHDLRRSLSVRDSPPSTFIQSHTISVHVPRHPSLPLTSLLVETGVPVPFGRIFSAELYLPEFLLILVKVVTST